MQASGGLILTEERALLAKAFEEQEVLIATEIPGLGQDINQEIEILERMIPEAEGVSEAEIQGEERIEVTEEEMEIQEAKPQFITGIHEASSLVNF